ncbi:MAG TPA: hypothetical protein VGW74_05050 [Propionibacteriaceae bacterium]|nr:hypothetical protein [Propionibacteriaceae bacterium]
MSERIRSLASRVEHLTGRINELTVLIRRTRRAEAVDGRAQMERETRQRFAALPLPIRLVVRVIGGPNPR